MSTLGHNFNDIAQTHDDGADQRPKYPPPFSIRFTFEERARLDTLRGRRSLAAYIRECLFGNNAAPRKKPGNSPIVHAEALARVLGALGASRLSSNLNQLAKAVHMGTLPVTPETEEELQEACAEVKALRSDLMRALGKMPEPRP